MNTKEKKIGIVGGGIGGLTMALTLKTMNLPFNIYEKSRVFTEVGAGIAISSNGLKIFDKLKVGNELRKKGHLIKRSIFATEKLKTLKVIPYPEEVFCIHRALIIEVLSKELDKESCALNKELINIENGKTVKVNFKDNTSAEFDTLIAADGINSIVRKSIFPQIRIREARQIIWRGITTFDIDEDLKHSFYELFEGTLRFLFIPINDSQIFWLAVQAKKNFKKDSTKSLKAYLLETYQNFDDRVLDMLNKTNNSVIIQNELADLKPNYRKWFENNTVFIGDAIHATTPNLGQGANQAIEDAYTLGVCIENDTKNTFSEYQNLREKKVEFIVKQSWMFGKLTLANYRLHKVLLHWTLKYLPEKHYQNIFDRIMSLEYLNKLENTTADKI